MSFISCIFLKLLISVLHSKTNRLLSSLTFPNFLNFSIRRFLSKSNLFKVSKYFILKIKKEISYLSFFKNKLLFFTHDPKHVCSAIYTNTFHSLSTVLHSSFFSIFHLTFNTAFHTTGFYHLIILPFNLFIYQSL